MPSGTARPPDSTPDNIRRSAKELTPDELTAIRADMAKWNGRLVEMWQARRAELDAITVGDAVEDAAGIPA
jgi:hypothetical protein